ncbi:MAG TPA: DUF2784 domain-containing protein [Terriglobales bacterium]|nr:DUF2784 domain-containing protein [Terriglobales bacterium]
MPGIFEKLASAVLVLHLLFILWVIFGALLAYRRPWLRWLHIASLVWGILTEVTPAPCPLTLLELWLEGRAGLQPYQGGFLLHYLDATVYPNVSPTVLVIAGVAVCAANLGIYAYAFAMEGRRRRGQGSSGSATKR